MNKGKNIWISQAVVDYLDSMLGDRDGGGVFNRESYNKVLLEILELIAYEPERYVKYDVGGLKVGEQQIFTVDNNGQYFYARRVASRIGKKTGRTYEYSYYPEANRLVITRLM